MHPEAITRVWVGGEHSFFLGIGQWRALENQCKAGVQLVYLRLLGQQFGIDDVEAPIRLGLIGAGMEDEKARALVTTILDTTQPYKLFPLAFDLISAFWVGGRADNPGESSAGEEIVTHPRPFPTEPLAGADT